MLTLRSLAVTLEKLGKFKNPDLKKEQYSTPGNVAAQALWNAHMLRDIDGKIVVDLGCGTGILGIGALLLGAKKVVFLDVDENALEVCKENISRLKEDLRKRAKIIHSDVCSFENMDFKINGGVNSGITDGINGRIYNEINPDRIYCDTIIMNPPFGTKDKHADKRFLELAIRLGRVTYSFHKSSTESFVRSFCKDNNKEITHTFRFEYPLSKTYAHHSRTIKRIDVSLFRIE